MIKSQEVLKEIVAKRKGEFEEQLKLIDTKYDRWFSGRIHPSTGDTDHVHNYFRYTYGNEGEIKLYLKDGLPYEISKDCKRAFKAIFEN